MKIGFIGLGKLGMPCAVAISLRGHDVMGYDVSPERMSKNFPHKEEGIDGLTFQQCLDKSTIRFGSLEEVVRHSELIFVAVQTPHDERYEGITPLPPERKDFDYEHLKQAVGNLSKVIESVGQKKCVTIISTVLPGTLQRDILPLLGPHIQLVYNPFFIAMGTTMRDFLNPEFLLIGVVDADAADRTIAFYKTIHKAPVHKCSLSSAELTKVAYNTFIGMKIAFVNALMEICEKIPGTDVDDVTDGLKLATDRVISPKYLTAGMGDGGGCHPRDNIALSWLARKLDLSYDIFESIMLAREKQAQWLGELLVQTGLPIFILGYAYKPETNLHLGSPAVLVKNLIKDSAKTPITLWDPYVEGGEFKLDQPHAILVGTMHSVFKNYKFPAGSIVIDPWRFIADQPGVKIVRVGESKSS